MATEIHLNLSNCPITYTATAAQADAFISHFRIDTTDFLNRIYFAIAYESLQDLEVGMNDGARESDTFARALRIYYGIDNGVLKPVFVPVFMDLKNGTTDEFNITPASIDTATNIYVYSNGVFAAITSNTANSYLQAYRDDIRIKHTNNVGFEGFDSDHDARAILFPFQEINQLYTNNVDIIGTDLYFYYTSKPDGSGVYRQEIVIMPFNAFTPTNSTIGGMFSNKAANFGGLCPPNCQNITYPVI